MRLRWLASQSTSALHAASAMAQGRTLVDGELAAALASPVDELRRDLASLQVPEARFLRMACALATTFDNNRQLAKMALYRTLGKASPDAQSERLGGRIADVEAALRRHNAEVLEELDYRSKPLREHWEARGPGLLRRLFEITDPRLAVEGADIVLVLPVLGGGGAAQLQNNSVRIEAVLANPHAQLPEVARLGWMIGQLHLDLPVFAEEIDRDRLPHIAALAMIPPALAAAQHVELAALDDEHVRLAIEAWHVQVPSEVEPVDVVMRWWEAFEQAQPPFEVAFKALDRMLV
jgi:hypothetical protein